MECGLCEVPQEDWRIRRAQHSLHAASLQGMVQALRNRAHSTGLGVQDARAHRCGPARISAQLCIHKRGPITLKGGGHRRHQADGQQELPFELRPTGFGGDRPRWMEDGNAARRLEARESRPRAAPTAASSSTARAAAVAPRRASGASAAATSQRKRKKHATEAESEEEWGTKDEDSEEMGSTSPSLSSA
eukprot:6188844-Pleurochrysis_carterae.AAC.2